MKSSMADFAVSNYRSLFVNIFDVTLKIILEILKFQIIGIKSFNLRSELRDSLKALSNTDREIWRHPRAQKVCEILAFDW